MAPPRQRPPPSSIPGGGDDSRSEASSTATGGPTSRGVPGPKPRKAAANNATGGIPGAATTGTLASAKELKVAAATGAAAAAAANAAAAAMSGLGQGNGVDLYGLDGLRDDLPGIPWHQMPLSILHDYRHAYKLSTPSAYARPISKLYFSSGIGLRSPTAIAARKAASAVATSSSSSSSSSSTSSGPTHRSRTAVAGAAVLKPTSETNRVHKINSQDRVGKEQLALAVRKHFNAAGLVEQDAIAKFLYKVREEGKGREFRLRFQP